MMWFLSSGSDTKIIIRSNPRKQTLRNRIGGVLWSCLGLECVLGSFTSGTDMAVIDGMQGHPDESYYPLQVTVMFMALLLGYYGNNNYYMSCDMGWSLMNAFTERKWEAQVFKPSAQSRPKNRRISIAVLKVSLICSCHRAYTTGGKKTQKLILWIAKLCQVYPQAYQDSHVKVRMLIAKEWNSKTWNVAIWLYPNKAENLKPLSHSEPRLWVESSFMSCVWEDEPSLTGKLCNILTQGRCLTWGWPSSLRPILQPLIVSRPIKDQILICSKKTNTKYDSEGAYASRNYKIW